MEAVSLTTNDLSTPGCLSKSLLHGRWRYASDSSLAYCAGSLVMLGPNLSASFSTHHIRRKTAGCMTIDASERHNEAFKQRRRCRASTSDPLYEHVKISHPYNPYPKQFPQSVLPLSTSPICVQAVDYTSVAP
ncbi:hypothetical protein AC579_3715 [Pseudocercospora musae]|uniref:Uncharacterized protein n=1 Tax=Pseudocercospora musae TaxID=113226 RepID=A0A139IIP3_9PEZI|nr:hypothetical protein AC579_3715 [Pseudocercospora musae]